MELYETSDLMNSENYKDRFKAEYYQLKIRRDKLQKMLIDWDNGILCFEPICPRSTYDLQIAAMNNYLAILEARAVMEKIFIQE